MANELAASTSPYLRAHADNPVDWRMWTKDTLDEAAERDLPLLISIGYSTCHWCHVMAHESFEDPRIAELINDRFVPIKIDREELPDVDAHYMNALQAMRGQGGWPMTIFATPTGSPFYAGTYFPPAPRGTVPSFTQVLDAVSQTWTDRRAEVTEMSQRMDRGLAEMATAVTDALPAEAIAETLTPEELDAAAAALLDTYDPAWGGFGSAPKFPPSMNLLQLLAAFVRLGGTASAGDEAEAATDPATVTDPVAVTDPAAVTDPTTDPVAEARRTGRLSILGADGHLTGELVLDCLIAVRSTFAHIAAGGMRDQVRGGIARYSVDRQWFVPHFEKMLYDNALYLRAAVAWAKVERGLDPGSKWLALAEREIDDTADFMIADLSDSDRFIAALDADSLNADGRLEEGAAYVVTPEEFAQIGGSGVLQLVDSPAAAELSGQVIGAPRIVDWLGMDDVPFDADHPAPWATEGTAQQRRALRKLLDTRPWPAEDEKTITEWNALAITALAEAALYRHPDLRASVWGSAAAHFWEAMDERFTADVGEGAVGDAGVDGAGVGDAAAASGGDSAPGVRDRDVRRSFTGGVPGPGAAGLADWAQMIIAGLTVLELRTAGLAGGTTHSDASDDALTSAGLAEMAAVMLEKFTSRGEDGVLTVIDSTPDDLIGVRGSDPVDSVLPSGRAAAAEAMLLLGELGVAGDGTDGHPPLTTGTVLETRDRLLGVYRALAQQAPRGCGHALWQAERALAPIRVASRDDDLLTLAAKHPAVTVLTDSTGVFDENGAEVAVPAGAAIVCRGTACSLPVSTAEELTALLDG